MMNRGKATLIASLSVLILCACCGKSDSSDVGTAASKEMIQEMSTTEAIEDTAHGGGRQTMTFVDVFGKEYQTEINSDAAVNKYDPLHYKLGKYMSYEDDNFYSRVGVDVSHHQGYIDWKAVKEDGVDFAFIRIGYRGYGKKGLVDIDREYARNIVNAKKAGLDVGVYFFSQAINENEAAEEAEFVIRQLKDQKLDLPVVYDQEHILDDDARTDTVSGEQFTKNAQVFCSMISEAGYSPAIYCNMLWEAFEYDMAVLAEYPFWYADYEPKPQTPYDFKFWQYTEKGTVRGINGLMDINIEMIKK